ncbi:MAG: hypothetical protein D6706_06400 [Chloroflexi bacterium]|nr:MAG: hypothetical protein D6706_06400 [Chloroflexota bacterium]
MTHLTEQQINEYLDGELDAATRLDVERHLAACVVCRQTMNELQTVFNMLDALPEISPSTDLTSRVLNELAPQPIPGWWLLLAGQAFAAALLLRVLWPAVQTAVNLGMPYLKPLFTFTWPSLSPDLLFQLVREWVTAVSLYLEQFAVTPPSFSLPPTQWGFLVLTAFVVWLAGNHILLQNGRQENRREVSD